MNINQLYNNLLDAYTIHNLNNISLTLINLYKEKQFSILQKIAEIIEDFFEIKINSEGKGFSKLIKLYHPDKLSFYTKTIKYLFKNNDFNKLLEYSHILKMLRIDEISEALNDYEDIDYSPVYEWDINEEEFHIQQEDIEESHVSENTKFVNCSVFDVIKIRQYGKTNVEFPLYYLEDFEEFEMASSGITDLDGIQYCIHAKNIDLSDNNISDISLLEGLVFIEELNLSYNNIEDIAPVRNLVNIKYLDLRGNNIKDLSPLLGLQNLDYLMLETNKINESQVKKLKEQGVEVIYK